MTSSQDDCINLMNNIDKIKNNIPQGTYIELCNLTKKIYDNIPPPSHGPAIVSLSIQESEAQNICGQECWQKLQNKFGTEGRNNFIKSRFNLEFQYWREGPLGRMDRNIMNEIEGLKDLF